MTKNPYYNAILALLYVALVVNIINFGSKWAGDQPNLTILVPIGMLSLFVISAAIMAYIVLYQPIIIFLDGKRIEALRFFWRTIAMFSVVTGLILVAAITIVKH